MWCEVHLPLDVAWTCTAVRNAEQNSVREHEMVLAQCALVLCLLRTALSLSSLDFLATGLVVGVLDLLAANEVSLLRPNNCCHLRLWVRKVRIFNDNIAVTHHIRVWNDFKSFLRVCVDTQIKHTRELVIVFEHLSCEQVFVVLWQLQRGRVAQGRGLLKQF